MHHIHTEMFYLCKEFLSAFIKAEFLPEDYMSKFLAVSIKNPEMRLADKFLKWGNFLTTQSFCLFKFEKLFEMCHSFQKEVTAGHVYSLFLTLHRIYITF